MDSELAQGIKRVLKHINLKAMFPLCPHSCRLKTLTADYKDYSWPRMPTAKAGFGGNTHTNLDVSYTLVLRLCWDSLGAASICSGDHKLVIAAL